MDMDERAAELERLYAEVRACTKCPLHLTRKNAVPGEGPLTAKIMLVGEAPGQREDEQGRPFVGASGQWLTELLALGGLKREEVYITNIVKSRPPNNRDPLPEEVAACQGYLERQLELIQPRLVITLGRHSMTWFCGPGQKISQVHGRARRARGFAVLTMYHPAAGLHNPDLKSQIADDFRKIPRLLAALEKEEATAGKREAESDTAEAEDKPSQLSLF
jgi:uracil-DNA glycosylase